MADQPDDLFLLPCSICSRTFRPDALVRHEKVCEKTLTKKRNVFNSFKHRVEGTELQEFIGPAPLPGQPIKQPKLKPVSNKVKKWRQTHEALVATLRAARGVDAPSSTTPTLSIITASDSEQCPSCGRNFGPRAFDRHVEFCREVHSRNPKTPNTRNNPAQARMEARIKYRAPLLLKKSRQKDASPAQTVTLPKSFEPSKTHRSISTPSSSPSSASTAPITRSASNRNSLRIRNATFAKRPDKGKTGRVSSPDKLPTIKNTKTMAPVKDSYTTQSTTMKKIAAAAEQQMRDLLSWPSDSNLSTQMKEIHPRYKTKTTSTIQVSPTSAFTPVVNKLANLSVSSETDGYSMLTSTPKASPVKPHAPHKTVHKTDGLLIGEEIEKPSRRQSVASISSQPSDCTLADEGVFWANLESMLGNKKSRKKTLARSKSVFEDRNRMLFLQTYDPELTSSEEDSDNKKRDNQQPSFLTYPDSCNPRPGYQTDDDEPAREINLAAGDSAYSSLNRQEKDQGPMRKVSKFCHECGSKFPLALAKFCCECGVRRLLI